MPSPEERAAVRQLTFGLLVNRAAAALPQSTAAPIFTITGGRIILTSIVGEVTTVIQTQANNTKLVANPDVGTSIDMCAVLDITADEVGCLYGITGIPGDAMIGAGAGLGPALQRPQVLNAGTIDLSCAASNTGAVKWSLTYVPLDGSAVVVAA